MSLRSPEGQGMDTMTNDRLGRFTTDTKDFATHVAALERHVSAVVDPIAAMHTRAALRELEALTELLVDPEL